MCNFHYERSEVVYEIPWKTVSSIYIIHCTPSVLFMEQRQRVHTQIKHRRLRRMVVEFTVMTMLINCSIRVKMKNPTQKQRSAFVDC